MKLYESAYTYFPIFYLYASVSLFAFIYHHRHLEPQRPFVLLTWIILNLGGLAVLKTHRPLIKNVVQYDIWRTVYLGNLGIAANHVHLVLFEADQIQNEVFVFLISLLYYAAVMVSTFYAESDALLVVVNVAFLYFPLRVTWQINLYAYVMLMTASLIILYKRVRRMDIGTSMICTRPVLRYFMYLRTHELMIAGAFVELYLEYYRVLQAEVHAVEEVARLLVEARQTSDSV